MSPLLSNTKGCHAPWHVMIGVAVLVGYLTALLHDHPTGDKQSLFIEVQKPVTARAIPIANGRTIIRPNAIAPTNQLGVSSAGVRHYARDLGSSTLQPGIAQTLAMGGAFLISSAAAFILFARHGTAAKPFADMEGHFSMAATSGSAGRKVAVTGAGGRTGKLVVAKLLQDPTFTPVSVVKSDKAVQAVKSLGVPEDSIKTASVTGDVKSLTEAFTGCEAVVLCTSAVPQIQYFSLIKVFLGKLFGQAARPTFTFPEGGSPEEVDWIGVKNQVDAAKAAGVKHFIMVSSMGGTQPDNFLNTIGKKPDGTGGDILLWKRKGEKYLIESGLQYTIIHPGGLLDQEGGKREIIFGVDDKLLQEKVRSIPRADVAEVCVQALKYPAALNRSFDIISKPEGEGTVTTDFGTFFEKNTANCDYAL